MSKGIRAPRFQLEKVYDDGSREEPQLYSLTAIDATCRMGRRGFLLTSAIGAGALAALSVGCGAVSELTKGADPPRPNAQGYPPNLPRVDAPKTHGLVAHKKTVHFLEFSQDGKTLFSASSDDTVKLWSVPDGKPQNAFGGSSEPELASVAISADNKAMVTGHFKGKVMLWQAPFKDPAKEMGVKAAKNTGVAFGPGDKIMAVSTQEGLQLYSFPAGEKLATLEANAVSQIVFSSDRAVLAGAFPSGGVQFWAAPSGDTFASWNITAQRMAFSPDGTLLGSTFKGVLQLNRMPTGDVEMMLDAGAQADAPLAFSPDGKWLAVRAKTSSILLIPAPFSKPVLQLDGCEGRVFTLAFSKDSRYLAAGTTSGAIYIWEMSGAEMRCEFKAVFYDPANTPQNVSVRHAVSSEKSVYIGRCGDPLPAGAVCTCNCVAGRAPVGGTICTCNTVTTCTCNTVPVRSTSPSRGGGGGGSYCSCNKICTCVPIK